MQLKISKTTVLTPGNGAPLYCQIRDYFKEQIVNGVLKAGDQIYPERKLAQLLDVSQITVIQALRELNSQGYLRRQAGKGTFVAERNSKCFTVVVSEINAITQEYINLILLGIEQEIRPTTSRLSIFATHDKSIFDTENGDIREQIGDNLIICSPISNSDINRLVASNIPFVTINNAHPKLDFPIVICEYKKVGIHAFQYLHEKGCRNIGVISGRRSENKNSVIRIADNLIAGCFQGASRCSAHLSEEKICECDYSPEDAKRQMRFLLSKKDAIDGVFLSGDNIIAGALDEVKRRKLKIGKDLQVFALRDTGGKFPYPYYRIPLVDMGVAAVRLLCDLTGQRTKGLKRILKMKFFDSV